MYRINTGTKVPTISHSRLSLKSLARNIPKNSSAITSALWIRCRYRAIALRSAQVATHQLTTILPPSRNHRRGIRSHTRNWILSSHTLYILCVYIQQQYTLSNWAHIILWNWETKTPNSWNNYCRIYVSTARTSCTQPRARQCNDDVEAIETEK